MNNIFNTFLLGDVVEKKCGVDLIISRHNIFYNKKEQWLYYKTTAKVFGLNVATATVFCSGNHAFINTILASRMKLFLKENGYILEVLHSRSNISVRSISSSSERGSVDIVEYIDKGKFLEIERNSRYACRGARKTIG